MNYSAVIRTLGVAGEKYQKLLDSLVAQTVKPKQIIVYIAEGYPIPKETVGIERYVYVNKGMVAQRALRYDEVDTEYILFLDDDVYLEPDSVSVLYAQLIENNAEVISPDVFPNAERSRASAFMMAVSGRMRARNDDGEWAYKVMRTGGYSYNANPQKPVYRSQTNAGPCLFCKKSTFLSIHFEEEKWMDKLPYAMGDDQIMYYKMHLLGYKVLTSFDSGVKHLDAGSSLRDTNKDKTRIFCDTYFKVVFWHRFLWSVDNVWIKVLDIISIAYYLLFTISISVLKLQRDVLSLKCKAIKDSLRFLKSDEYNRIPKVERV